MSTPEKPPPPSWRQRALASPATVLRGAPVAIRERVDNTVRRPINRRRFSVERAFSAGGDDVHLVPSPVFLLSSVRSGSTLLRSMLDTHTQIVAPHELHLATMRVSTDRAYAADAWSELGLSIDDLQNVLWDRALHLTLVRSGGRIVVDKTPQNAEVWQRIHAFWPKARYLHLRRHPGSVFESLVAARPEQSASAHVANVLRYGRWLDEARETLPGPTVRYEQLTADPDAVLREICGYLGVHYQRRMLKYRRTGVRGGLGDWSSNIRSGRVQAGRPLPTRDQVPSELHGLIGTWDY